MADERPLPHFEQTPLTRAEYISALSHFYRAEMHRSLVWRSRLDTTTNWAIVATVAILTASLQAPEYAAEAILLGMASNLVLLILEARRFRFFDVWRSRVRMIEENFYSGILRRDQSSHSEDWGRQVADDLFCPRFHLTRLQAFRARLVRNFGFIFAFLLVAWAAFRLTPMEPNSGFGLASLPPHLPDVCVGIFYLVLIAIAVFTPDVRPPEEAYWSHPDRPGEDLSTLDV